MPERDEEDRIEEVKRFRVRYLDGKTAMRSRHKHTTAQKGLRRTSDLVDNDYPSFACLHFWGTGRQLGGVCPVCRKTSNGVICDTCATNCTQCMAFRCKAHTFPSDSDPTIRLCEACASLEKMKKFKEALCSLGKTLFLKKAKE
jgi:hypothetical protein